VTVGKGSLDNFSLVLDCFGRNLIFTLFLLVILFQSEAQIFVTPGSTISMTPQQFVEANLVGNGVSVSNATFNGSSLPFNVMGSTTCLGGNISKADQIGLFTVTGPAAAQLQITSGIILSSGKVQEADRTLAPTSQASTATCSGADPDLALIGGSLSEDKAVLEFDFIPMTDVVSFRYVFASEEFDDMCGEPFNDVFGFFLSSVGISGGMGYVNDAVNIAIMPSTPPIPVTTNNICATDLNIVNGTYSWWNGSGNESPPFTYADGPVFTYDRFSHVFTATYPVTCNVVHHIKIALSDIMDRLLDSGIFLEANSFSSTQIEPHVQFSNPAAAGDTLLAGCNTATLHYTIVQPRNSDLAISLMLDPIGSAGQADILPNPFPVITTIPAGSLQSPVITIQSVPEPPGPPKYLVVKGTTETCGTFNNYFTTVPIIYNAPFTVSLTPQTICSSTSVILAPVVTGGQPFSSGSDYHYLWSTGATTGYITVLPPPGINNYTVSVTDACSQVVVASTTVSVDSVPEAAGPITGETSLCFPATGKVYSVSPIAGADTYSWTLPPGGIITGPSDGPTITVDFTTGTIPGLITVKGHNNLCGDGLAASLQLSLLPLPVVTFPPPLSPVCSGDPPVSLSGNPAGGSFSGAGVTGTLFYPQAAGAGSHQVSYNYTDPNGCTSGVSHTILVKASTILTLTDFPSVCISASPFPLSGGSPPGGSYTGTGVAGGVFYPSVAGVGIHPITYSYTNPDNCTSSVVKTIIVAGLPMVDFSGPVLPEKVCQDYPDPSVYEVPADPSTTFAWSIPAPYTMQGSLSVVTGFPNRAEIQWSGTGTAQVKLMATSAAGCENSNTKNVFINPKPSVGFTACFDEVTTLNARPFVLRGGTPAGVNGNYAVDGLPVTGGVLNPATLTTGTHTISFTYTNVNGCKASDSKTITVATSNATYQCSSGIFTDPRNPDPATNKYPTAIFTFNGRSSCWMLKNLNWGITVIDQVPQTDNCIAERYCRTGDNGCLSYGALYQWDEVIQYGSTPGWSKGVCPPGWHVPTISEWQDLLDANTGKGNAARFLSDPYLTSGFHALFPGIYYLNNTWAYFTSDPVAGTMFWTSDLNNSLPVARGMNNRNFSVSWYESSKANAFPVRCVKD